MSMTDEVSSASCDRLPHTGSFTITSRRTLVSTRITPLVAAQQLHDLVRRHGVFEHSPDFLERAWMLPADGGQHDLSTFDGDIYFGARLEPRCLAHALGDRHLRLAGHGGRGHVLPHSEHSITNAGTA